MAEQITGYCPGCGKQLQIPAELEQFACMYCGKMMKKEELLPSLAPDAALTDAEIEQAWEQVRAQIVLCVDRWPESYKRINKQDFAPYSDKYLETCRPVFDRLEQCAKARPGSAQYWGERAAQELMTQTNEWMQAQKVWRSKSKRRQLIDETKFTIAIFLVPMLSRIPLETAKPFVTKLRDLWVQTYPNSPFSLATYQELKDGFRKRLFCFVTTAVCRAQGLPDDCAQLQAFRAFRDGWLAQQPDGPRLIAEYYNVAPAIVLRIDQQNDAARRYEAIRRAYLQPCWRALQAGRPNACKRRYVKMVRSLEKEYLS